MPIQYVKGGRRRWRAERVLALRRHLRRTQRELAHDLGVRQQTISDWETGIYEPRGASRTLLNIIAEGADFKYEVGEVEENDPGGDST